MKIWVPRQREVTVEVIATDNPDNDLKAGDMAVTDADGKTRIYSPDEFAERFEESRKWEWPGYFSMANERGYNTGTLAIALEADTAVELAEKVNAWAEDRMHRHLIATEFVVGASPSGKHYAFWLANSQKTKEELEYLAQLDNSMSAALEKKMAENKEKEEGQLTKARDLQNAAKVVEKTRIRELERLAEAGRKHEANCGKRGGKK